MVYGCGNKCIKYMVFVFNFFVCIVGAAVLGTSLAVRFSNDVQKYLQNILDKNDTGINIDQIYIALYVLAAVGGFLFLTGFLGCCGACCESTCLLALFFSIILVLFVAELACGIAILIKKNAFKEALETAVTKQIKRYDSLDKDVQDAINRMQRDLTCCGCTGYGDYQRAIPESCPKPAETAIGCCTQIWGNMEKHIGIVAGVAIGILVVELLAMIFSCILCQAFRRGDYQAA